MSESTFGKAELLKRGVESQEVASLQKVLVNMGYDVGTVDGSFGAETAAAVEKFQTDHNLKVDGVVGPQTGAAIDHYYKMKLEERAAMRASALNASASVMPTGGTSTATDKTLKPVKKAAKGLSMSAGSVGAGKMGAGKMGEADKKAATAAKAAEKTEESAEKTEKKPPKAPFVQTGFSIKQKK